MIIFPLPAFQDNYIWIIRHNDSSLIWAIDPGDANVVQDYCQQNDKQLAGILITHHHKDHTGGVAELKETFQCPVFGPAHLTHLITHPMAEDDQVNIFERSFRVLETPGHTLDHLCYFSDQPTPILFSGDTLFRGGCGRIMEGTAEQMLAAMQKISDLPDDTLVYCTHEYTLANYRFALSLEPENQSLIDANLTCQTLRQQKQVTLPSKLELEKKNNPFLRSHVEAVKVQAAQQLSEEVADQPSTTFGQVRRAKDSFS